MATKQLVGDMSEWSGMFMDLHRQIGDGSITKSNMQAFLEHREPFAISNIREEWQEFYRKYFRITVDFSDVAIPDDPGGLDRVGFIPQGLTTMQVVKAMKKKFKVWTYLDDLDKDVIENVRNTSQSYAFRLRDRVEADEENANLSANQLKQRNENAITLLERLVLELKYFDETGEHLDINNITLCAGSRRSDGNVPGVGWRGGRLGVGWCASGHSVGSLRSRTAVS